MESAWISLQISSMRCSSCHRPRSFHFCQCDYSERRRKNKELVVMLPGTKFIQGDLSPARHNSIFTVLACLWIQFSLEHSLFPVFCCVLALLAFCSEAAYMSVQSFVNRCYGRTVVLLHRLQAYINTVQELILCVSSLFYTFYASGRK